MNGKNAINGAITRAEILADSCGVSQIAHTQDWDQWENWDNTPGFDTDWGDVRDK